MEAWLEEKAAVDGKGKMTNRRIKPLQQLGEGLKGGSAKGEKMCENSTGG